jgi:hypothetical protein
MTCSNFDTIPSYYKIKFFFFFFFSEHKIPQQPKYHRLGLLHTERIVCGYALASVNITSMGILSCYSIEMQYMWSRRKFPILVQLL